MVLLIIIPFLNGYNWEYTLFPDKPKWELLAPTSPTNWGTTEPMDPQNPPMLSYRQGEDSIEDFMDHVEGYEKGAGAQG